MSIINNVFSLVEDNCEELNTLQNKIISVKGISEEEYAKSCFIAAIKGKHGKQKQLYADRIINAHIGYLDRFRLYVLFNDWIEDKVGFNENLCKAIGKYIRLLHSALIMPKTKDDLLPYYEKQLKKIEETNYTNFDIAIKKDL